MDEKRIERKLRDMVRHSGGLALKFTSPGFDGVPDRLMLFREAEPPLPRLKPPGENQDRCR